MAKYKGITFAKGYNNSFADFVNEFGSTHVFKSLYPDEKERELKKAYKIATDVNIPTTVRKVKKSKPKTD